MRYRHDDAVIFQKGGYIYYMGKTKIMCVHTHTQRETDSTHTLYVCTYILHNAPIRIQYEDTLWAVDNKVILVCMLMLIIYSMKF